MFIVFISNSFKDTGNTLLWRNYSFWEYCFLKWSRRFGWCMKIHASARKGSLCNIWFSYLRDVYQNISNITNINSQYFLNQGSRDGLRRPNWSFGPLPLTPVRSDGPSASNKSLSVRRPNPWNLSSSVLQYPASASVPGVLFWTWTG